MKMFSSTGGPSEETSHMIDVDVHKQPPEKIDEPQKDVFQDPREAILEAALEHVSEYGWTDKALAAGAKDRGFPTLAHGMFMKGPIELVYFFMNKATKHMCDEVSKVTQETANPMGYFPTLELAMISRLEYIARFKDQWRDAIALGMLPQTSLSTAQQIAELADEICHLAGDQSADIHWYTKRAAVASLYASSELFMLTDQSQNIQDTRAFVVRRVTELETLLKMPEYASDVGIGLSSVVSAFGSAILSLSPIQPGRPNLDLLSTGVQAILNNLAALLPPSAPASSSRPGASAASSPTPEAKQEPSSASTNDVDVRVFEAAPEKDPFKTS